MSFLTKHRDPQLQIHINDLSEDCLLIIFSLITNLREKLRLKRVCKRWMHVIEKSLIYQHFSLKWPEEIYYDSEFKQMKNLIESSNNNELISYEFSRFRVPLSKLLISFRNLKVLHSTQHRNSISCIFNWDIKSESLPNFALKEIKLVNDNEITDEIFGYLINKCPKLEAILISGCQNLNGDFLFYLTSNLKILEINNCCIDNDKLNQWIQSMGKSLESLAISCSSIDFRTIISNINKNCDQMNALVLEIESK